MLSRIRIKNFKCLRDVDVELAPFTVLIGPNDSGKSSFLHSLQLCGQLGVGNASGDLARQIANILRANCWRLDPLVPVSIDVEAADPVEFQFSLELKPEDAPPTQILRIGAETTSLSMESNPPGGPQLEFRQKRFQPQRTRALLPQLIKQVAAEDLLSIQDMLRVSEPFRFSPPEMRKPVAAYANPILSSRGENLAAVVNALLTGPDRDAVNSLESSLHAEIPSLRGLSTPPGGQNGSERVIRFTLSGKEKPPLTIPASQVSDDAMFLTALLTLAYSQPAQVILIEEPENGLHPSRLQTVIDLLRKLTTGELGSQPRQIVMTTHSPILLNCVKPDEVRIFRRDEEGATNIVRMDQLPEIDRLTKEFAPGELWYLFGEEKLIQGQTV